MGEIASFWDREAASFDDEPDHGLLDPGIREAWSSLLTAHLPAAPARVADVGCGTGTLSVLLANCGYQLVGVDVSPQMLIRARTKALHANVGVPLVLGDAGRPPLRRHAFDAVVCRHVLWAMGDIEDALRRWSELLRPAGVMLIVEGQWSTGMGVSSRDVLRALTSLGRGAQVKGLTDAKLWGKDIDDDRYLVISSPE